METQVRDMLDEPQGKSCHVWLQHKPLSVLVPERCSYLPHVTTSSGSQHLLLPLPGGNGCPSQCLPLSQVVDKCCI